VTVPVGPLAPFVVGGVGFGGITNEGETGVALIGGGGLMIHFGHVFGLGAEMTYQTITGKPCAWTQIPRGGGSSRRRPSTTSGSAHAGTMARP
jgi:hypothetical protein